MVCLPVCYVGSYRELCDLIGKSTEVLMSNSQHLDNVLETLDLQQHTIGVLAVLCVKLSLQSQSPEEQEAVLGQVADFISHCNADQIKLAPDNCKYSKNKKTRSNCK